MTAAIDFVQSFVDAIAEAGFCLVLQRSPDLDEDPTSAAQSWILEACGVDISDENG